MSVLRASGWHPDLPDPRDYNLSHERVELWLRELPTLADRPEQIDWRWSCTACPEGLDVQHRAGSVHVCLELLEQLAVRVEGQPQSLSRPFVYHTTHRVAQSQGVPPLSLRAVLKAVRRFGVPPADLWPGEGGWAEAEPDAFAYGAARGFPELQYVRLDHRESSGGETLNTIRDFLAAGFLLVFGVPLGTAASQDGEIGFPTIFDTVSGGQALLAVGYDDRRRIRSDRGCLIVRGCWGRNWGEEGYGWLPYSYVREKLATDFWTVLQPEWLRSGEFQRPPLPASSPA